MSSRKIGLEAPSLYQQFIHKSRYARWLWTEKRRETWEETVWRYMEFMKQNLGDKLPEDIFWELYNSIISMEIMPSMRALMTAGKALERDNVAGYNCAYIAIDHPRAFDEILYILMCGTGAGFSCEERYVSQLPAIDEQMHDIETVIVVKDSKIGWASAYRQLLSLLWQGQIPQWDTSKVREKGAALKTFGGRASGPEPLEDLFRFTINIFKNAAGRKLRDIEVHDIVCKIAEIVVVGGVRRSALISLSDLNSRDMRVAKHGNWFEATGHRALANNSATYDGRPSLSTFFKEWLALYESKSGERGIFNRSAAVNQVKAIGRREHEGWLFGTNPCSEIILRSGQFCNLCEVVVRPNDTQETLLQKVRLATILGTYQATLTNFRYLRKKWQNNCEEERLLGVSLTGIMDHNLLGKSWRAAFENGIYLEELLEKAVTTNEKWSDILGINVAAAITCVKPSGTVSQLVNSSSGIHDRWSKNYIRNVLADKKDPLCKFLQSIGLPNEQSIYNNECVVFSFPIFGPEGSGRSNRSAIEQLMHWKWIQDEWCEHKPSCTIYVKENEWLEVAAWVWKNFNSISGVAFLPSEEGQQVYQQAPYQDAKDEELKELLKKFPDQIDWNELKNFEQTDFTVGAKTYACTGDKCEIVDLR